MKTRWESVNQKDKKIIYQGSLNVPELFQPSFNEMSLFLMSLSSILLLIGSQELRNDILSFVAIEHINVFPWHLFFLGFIFLIGITLSLLHPFLSRKKNPVEKIIMAWFAIIVNGGTGLFSGFQMLIGVKDFYLIFPIINILSAFYFLVIRVGADPNRSINDENAKLQDVIVGSAALIVIFIICQFYLQLAWAMTFSICISYSTLFYRIVAKILDLLNKDRISKNGS